MVYGFFRISMYMANDFQIQWSMVSQVEWCMVAGCSCFVFRGLHLKARRCRAIARPPPDPGFIGLGIAKTMQNTLGSEPHTPQHTQIQTALGSEYALLVHWCVCLSVFFFVCLLFCLFVCLFWLWV